MKNIVLTGFMGTGKTTVSAELARLTGFRSVEVDAEVERAAGMRIAEIFERLGESRFRDMESAEILRLSGRSNLVISTGGGAIMRAENVETLRSGGVIVCLTASPETILERTRGNVERPLLQVEDPLERIRHLLAQRRTAYEQADIAVDTEGKSPLEVAAEILDRLAWKQ